MSFPVIAKLNNNVSITLFSISPLPAFHCDNDILQGNSFNDCIKVSVMKSNDIQLYMQGIPFFKTKIDPANPVHCQSM
jgi:hypothetical protein